MDLNDSLIGSSWWTGTSQESHHSYSDEFRLDAKQNEPLITLQNNCLPSVFPDCGDFLKTASVHDILSYLHLH